MDDIRDEECEKFMALLPKVLDDTIDGIEDGLFDLKGHFRRVLDYSIGTEKRIRSLIVAAAYRMFEKEENLTPENMRLCYIMGWILEIGFASETIFLEIMDKLKERQGVPCWHTRKNIGTLAINDALLLEQAVYYLFNKHFGDHPNLLSFYKLFHEVALKNFVGIVLARKHFKSGKPDLTTFTIDNYLRLIKNRKAYFNVCAPAELAMYLANVTDEGLHKKARILFLQLGELLQIQDDYLDCFGEVEKTGERGLYIKQGQFTWLAVKALEAASPAQRKIMEKYYGSPEPGAVEAVCRLYEELDLAKAYSEHEQESLDKMQALFEIVSEELPTEMFAAIIEKLYNRKF